MAFGSKTTTSLVNTNPLRRLKKVLGMGDSSHPAVTEMYKRWAKIYKGFLHTRFKAASTGNGTWKPLSTRTIKRKKSSLILIETRTLIDAVNPEMDNAPGSFMQRTGFVLEVGYGGSAVHPTSAKNRRRITVEQIAGFHQKGVGKLPQRRIVVGPDKPTIALVTAEINKTVGILLNS